MRNMNEQMKSEPPPPSDTFNTPHKPSPKNGDKGDYIDFEEI